MFVSKTVIGLEGFIGFGSCSPSSLVTFSLPLANFLGLGGSGAAFEVDDLRGSLSSLVLSTLLIGEGAFVLPILALSIRCTMSGKCSKRFLINLVPIANLSALTMDIFSWHNCGHSALLKVLGSCLVTSQCSNCAMNKGNTVSKRSQY